MSHTMTHTHTLIDRFIILDYCLILLYIHPYYVLLTIMWYDSELIFRYDLLLAQVGHPKLEDITFTYYGMRNQKFDVTAVCQTEGGPEQLGSKHIRNIAIEHNTGTTMGYLYTCL